MTTHQSATLTATTVSTPGAAAHHDTVDVDVPQDTARTWFGAP
ncbi:hypothetical protein [Kitasatospora kifunensis]|uniref:Meiotically up-regulated gene 157 (Mug157) protein n=1 Tax=Kitasatospora kifunensis TaxID=58351 RepID=A0A7W7R6U3_KITKI|nr:hypothetical protein [Kitasatospora kifunensis]MBB4926314.1 meiotically up-regulated gene 157 (Mug157) protein [Kitasatospora kifunensis]